MRLKLALIIGLLSFCCLAWSFGGCAAQLADKAEQRAKPAEKNSAGELETVSGQEDVTANDGAELALVLSGPEMADYSYEQNAWQALEKLAKEKELQAGYYTPASATAEAYAAAISQAAEGGAKLIICAGTAMEAPIYDAQTQYPDINFLLIDGEPHSGDFSTYALAENTCAVYFAEEQAGFLAGYAAVKNGYALLGFLGGMPVPQVIRYGYGFIYGARYAANEDNKSGIQILYHYSGSFNTTESAQTLAGNWFNNGAQIIFSCDSGASAILAAEAADGQVIAADIDQSLVSDTVAVSALKIPAAAVNLAVKDYLAGRFPGGRQLRLGAAENAVGLSVDNLSFADFGVKFTAEIYTAIFTKLALGEVKPPLETDYASAADMSSPRVTVTFVE